MMCCDSEDVAWLFFDGGKKMYKLIFFNCEHSFCTLYLKLQILDQLVWLVTCCENAIICVNVFERVLTVKLVYIYYIIAQWFDATRAAVKKKKEKGRSPRNTVKMMCLFENRMDF